MIASFAHNFIFIKTRKTAGTSIELALSSLCGDRDIITPISFDDEQIRCTHAWRSPQNFSDEPGRVSRLLEALQQGDKAAYRELTKGARRRNEYYNHMSATRMRQMLQEEFWERAHKWTVERHPYEKAVSRAYFADSKKGHSVERFQELLNHLITEGQIDERHLYTIDGQLAVDEVIRYEDLPGAFHSVLAKSGVRFDGPLPMAKTTQRHDRRPAREILSERQKEAIYASCRETFDLLGYQA